MKKLLLLLLLSLTTVPELFASHLRAGNIEVERVAGSTTKFLIRLTVYSDDETDHYDNEDGVPVVNPQKIYINNSPTPLEIFAVQSGIDVGNLTNKTVYEKIIDLPSSNGKFFIKWNGVVRNDGIKNITTVTATSPHLYVETFLFLNGFDAPNNSPRMSADPIDKGYVNTIFTYNSGAYDIDGDSLSYELVPIRAGIINNDGALIGLTIPGSISPADPIIGGGGSLSIDPVRGTVTWDRPKIEGEYNIAIKINEWRNGVRIGYVIRDMQIIIEDTDLEPPLLKLPNDTCVIAGTTLNSNIIAWDKNDERVLLEQYGLPKESGATLNNTPITIDSLVGTFNWSTGCEKGREGSYYAFFKAINNPGTNFSLTTYKEWQIKVIGAPVQNTTTTEVAGGVNLTWDTYCPSSTTTQHLELWRRSCDTTAVSIDYCTTGVPATWGFDKVAEFDKNTTTYLDKNIFKGNRYYYTLVAKFTDGSYSVPSIIQKIETTIDGPWITHASVLVHDSTKGKTLIDWSFSSVFNETGPYKIELLRSDQLTDGNYNLIQTLLLPTQIDSSFIDTLLDTYNGTYNYKINVYYQTNTLHSTSRAVSIIKSHATADQTNITLNWEMDAPLFTPDTLYNYIHRDYPTFGKTDSLTGENYSYLETDLIADSIYCYYIAKSTTYCNNEIDTIFYVNSTVSCAKTYDFIAPCPPILSIKTLDCPTFDAKADIQNSLWWTWDTNTCQREKIAFYDLFYRAKEEDEFQSIIQTKDTFFLHQFIDTYAGCYKIKAQDRSGNLSTFSNEVCNYNCESIKFPNIVTPNNDEKNDTFGPIPTPQFVEKIDFTVVNRWGKEIYHNSNQIHTLWDLKGSNGKLVTDGVYYFSAIVTFDKYKQEDREKVYNGWVVIIH